MNLPDIGDIITTKEALKLCRHFDLDYLVERIESDPENHDWMPMSRFMHVVAATASDGKPF